MYACTYVYADTCRTAIQLASTTWSEHQNALHVCITYLRMCCADVRQNNLLLFSELVVGVDMGMVVIGMDVLTIVSVKGVINYRVNHAKD